ncbi:MULTISPECIES: hypothetical protein [unclassified Rathayibacter]|uniref:hypothetical protein n=1 Tax=unclassified Rathayibacter TaxID=2609250 RepID=UPI00188B9195|nr:MULTISPECIES: hypothetical protein [unclassified Rathayibacter]MBF4462475.1 hypothetical protein [Rathayibacter sp. VKM Ac-2879]MBF4503482.1 hypothetical protein [Rathayibacter sp. VKM Ac-2878]
MDRDSSPLSIPDALALVAVLASLQGALVADALPRELERILRHHLERSGLLLAGSGPPETAAALGALSTRVLEAIAAGDDHRPPLLG